MGSAIGGIAGAIGNVTSAGITSKAAKEAAATQAAAANKATDASIAEVAQTRSDLSPYNTAGQNATNQLQSFFNGSNPTGELNALENTPGYQFALSQGLKSTQSSAAARGLGTSGAALKGAAQFATGLAQSTYQQNLLNPLLSLSQLGESAAAMTGNLGTAGTANANAAAIGGANATAGGIVGSANNIGGALSGIGGNLQNYQLYNKLLNGNGAGGASNYFDNTSSFGSPSPDAAVAAAPAADAGFGGAG
jgi:hypothetical protein